MKVLSRSRRVMLRLLTLTLALSTAFLMFSGSSAHHSPTSDPLPQDPYGAGPVAPGKYRWFQYLASTTYIRDSGRIVETYRYNRDGKILQLVTNNGALQMDYDYRSDGSMLVHTETSDVRSDCIYTKDGVLSEIHVRYPNNTGSGLGATDSYYNEHGDLLAYEETSAEYMPLLYEEHAYEYDDQGRKISDRIFCEGENLVERSYTYLDNGSCMEFYYRYTPGTHNLTDRCSYYYNSDGKLQNVDSYILDGMEVPISRFYSYNYVGHIRERSETVQTGKNSSTTCKLSYEYEYNSSKQPLSCIVTSCTWAEENGQKSPKNEIEIARLTWSYDKHGNLIRFSDGTETVEYTYDSLRNLH